MTSATLDEATFDSLRHIVEKTAGIQLGRHKYALVSARVRKRMRTLGIEEYPVYLEHLLSDTTGAEVSALIDVISTNVTAFFREESHFKVLREHYDRWIAQGQRTFRFWSAACATGEEPYTLAMSLCGLACATDTRILATDIAPSALATAREGIYSENRLRGVPPALRERHFTKVGPDSWQISRELRSIIRFHRLNLAAPPYPMSGPFDAIFIRNVMIYFDRAGQQALLDEACRLLRPGGLLIVGQAEGMAGRLTGLHPVQASVYEKRVRSPSSRPAFLARGAR